MKISFRGKIVMHYFATKDIKCLFVAKYKHIELTLFLDLN